MADLHTCFDAPPLAPPFAPSDRWKLNSWVGSVLPPIQPPPLAGATVAPPLPVSVGCQRDPPASPPPFVLLHCGDVEPRPGLLRVAQANVTSIHLHWHTVAEWWVDVVLFSETRLTVVAQQVMRAQARAAGWQAFRGFPRNAGRGASGMRQPGG